MQKSSQSCSTFLQISATHLLFTRNSPCCGRQFIAFHYRHKGIQCFRVTNIVSFSALPT
jgi:hypothetical protein